MDVILRELDVLFLADFSKAKRLTHPLVFVSLYKTEDVDANLADPFVNGVTIGVTTGHYSGRLQSSVKEVLWEYHVGSQLLHHGNHSRLDHRDEEQCTKEAADRNVAATDPEVQRDIAQRHQSVLPRPDDLRR